MGKIQKLNLKLDFKQFQDLKGIVSGWGCHFSVPIKYQSEV
jgi:hypothetical protein